MFKHSEKISIIISVVLGILFLVALAVVCYWLPTVVNSMIDVKDNIGDRNSITDGGRLFVVIDVYVMVAVAAVAVVLLFFLLRIVYRKQVFSKATTGLISAIAYCCFAEGLLSLLLITYFQLVVCAVLAACFLGLCLRVVGNVIEEATRIKNENDFTI